MKFVSDTKLARFLSKLATVAKTGSYNDLSNKPTIPSAVTESTVSGWGFTKNTGTYSKPSTGIPKTDLASAVQTSLGKADTALQSHQDISGKQDKITSTNKLSATLVSGLATVATSGSYNDLTDKPDNSKIIALTQAQYDAMASHESGTFYFITG